MTPAPPTRVGFIGAGAMARYHLQSMLGRDDTVVTAVCEPSADAYAAVAAKFVAAERPVPPNEPDWQRFVDDPIR